MPQLAQALEYYSYDDYKKWEGDWELIDGIAYSMAPSPMISHQAISGEITFELLSNVRKCKDCLVVIEQDWKVDEVTVLKPDVALICNETNSAYISKAPLIIVEVISKSTAKRDEKYKFEIYKNEKVLYYVLVYPNELRAKIYKLKEDNYVKEGDFSFEEYTFEDLKCKASIDFSAVFEKFRNAK